MELTEIGNIRLHNQKVTGTTFTTAQEIVSWLGAMQAQDYNMAKWAVGVRLPNPTDQQIETALDKGEIIRTHVLRPTWHFVSANDVYWMLALSAPQIKTQLNSRHKQLELTESIITKSNNILEKALANHNYLTREELVAELHKSGIATDNNRASHLFLRAELDAIICSGPTKNKKQTYALLPEWVPHKQTLTREEALAKLAHIYFTSHGPATLQDFNWWSGLSITDARKALELVKSSLISETVNSVTYWFSATSANYVRKIDNAYLLPAFDEFIISYKDRTASLLLGDHKKAISENGLFRPVIIINVKVIGLWKRIINPAKVLIETEFFYPLTDSTLSHILKETEKFGKFLGKPVEILFNN